jgi:hypothetical protein
MDLWEQQIELVLEQHGLISFIIHPDYLLEKRARDVYFSLLERLAYLRQQSKMWIPLPRQLNDWWRSRNEMRLVREGSSWLIKGSQEERARVAFAHLEDNRVVYSFESECQAHEIPTFAASQQSPPA